VDHDGSVELASGYRWRYAACLIRSSVFQVEAFR